MKLDPIRTFVEVVRANGFSAAAKQTGMPRSTVSLRVKALERSLGVRLLKRSTRSIALTDEGQTLYRQASGALDMLARTVDDLRNATGVLRGLIRMTAPADFPTDLLAKAVSQFSRHHPDVRFQIVLSSETRDLVRDNVDIALRVGVNAAMDSVERRLLDVEWGFFASSDWIARHGRPGTVRDIPCFISPLPALRRYLERTVLAGTPLPQAGMEVDNHLLARDLMLCGFGVALLPEGMCRGAVDAGNAHALLAGETPGRTRVNLLFPSRADMLPRVRAFADHLSAALGGA